MNEQENQQDKHLRSLFQTSELKDSLGITEKVMAQIKESPAIVTHAYKPPISRLGWICIVSMLIGLLLVTTAMQTTFSIQLPDFSPQFSAVTDQLRNTFNWSISELPELSLPLLTAMLVFNVAGMYFVLTYRRARRT